MEKRTMGKFIAVLRKANGMTQQELGDKLMVSDNTVSKWERDERMPDISLLPAIAEIFGITTDELLRGERNNPEREGHGTEETETKQRAKSDKQLKNMLNKKMRIYNSLTCVSVAITALGLIVGFLFVLYLQQYLMSAICFGFMVAAQVCQIVFANNALIRPDEDEQYSNQIGKFNLRVIDTVAWFTMANISIVVCFVLILIELFGDFLGAGCIIAITLALAEIIYVVYALAVRKAFEKRGFIVLADEKAKVIKCNRNLLKKMSLICGVGALVLVSVGHGIIGSPPFFLNRYYQKFEDVQEFKAYIEGEYDAMCEEVKADFYIENEFGELVLLEEEYNAYCEGEKEYYEIKSSDGTVLCEYYCQRILSYQVKVDYDNDGNIEISYLSWADNNKALMDDIEVARIQFYIVAAAYLGVCAVVYIILAIVNKKKVLAGAVDCNKTKEKNVEIVAE